MNKLLNLDYEPLLENLGGEYYDIVTPASFPERTLRFRNDVLLRKLGLSPQQVWDDDFIECFGEFQGKRPYLALKYHGYQFGQYNPELGDGRGFLYGQVRGQDGQLYDFGTKGSGRTPYSRQADGRLTLKGGVREVLAAEALHHLGVHTSRCLTMIETGEKLWRGDEPSPTRSSVMVRMSRSHIRFGTFERLHYLQRPDLIGKLLDHVIADYYPQAKSSAHPYAAFYRELVERTAKLAAQWMAVGFCHGVLNTDNMPITGESFDYGPYGFIDNYDPKFIAAYFDYSGRYSFGNQPGICKLNLEMLQTPLRLVMAQTDLDEGLRVFEEAYHQEFRRMILHRLGFVETIPEPLGLELVAATIQLVHNSLIGYHQFFRELTIGFNAGWRSRSDLILENTNYRLDNLTGWQSLYQRALHGLPPSTMADVDDRLAKANPETYLLRPEIEAVWSEISEQNNWEPFNDLVSRLQNRQ
ncbi:MAG: YdiU family protein [Synechococcaceae cyanobacterium RL_1_2]|nr:YdiU family protein [Synechococcaceae cyanobacterium RL_1_2]